MNRSAFHLHSMAIGKRPGPSSTKSISWLVAGANGDARVGGVPGCPGPKSLNPIQDDSLALQAAEETPRILYSPADGGQLAVEVLGLGKRPAKGRFADAPHSGQPDNRPVLPGCLDATQPEPLALHTTSFACGVTRRKSLTGTHAGLSPSGVILTDSRSKFTWSPNYPATLPCRTRKEGGSTPPGTPSRSLSSRGSPRVESGYRAHHAPSLVRYPALAVTRQGSY